jgi:hypothetical protein
MKFNNALYIYSKYKGSSLKIKGKEESAIITGFLLGFSVLNIRIKRGSQFYFNAGMKKDLFFCNSLLLLEQFVVETAYGILSIIIKKKLMNGKTVFF